MLERPSQRMSAAVGTDPSCIAQESPLLMCSLQTHLFQDSVSPRDLYSVRTAASLPPSAVLHTFQKWSQWVDLALRLWKSKRHFSCFWHEKDNVGHRTLLANFDHEQVPCDLFITSLGDDENLVSLMKTASVQFWSRFACGPNRFSMFFACFSQLLMVFHGFVLFSLVFQPSHFFITSLGDDENLVSLMKTASVRFWSLFACGPNRFSVFFMFFHSCLLFSIVFVSFFNFSTVSFFHHIVGGRWNSRFLDENRLPPTFVTIQHVVRNDFLCLFVMFFAIVSGFSWFCLFFLFFQPPRRARQKAKFTKSQKNAHGLFLLKALGPFDTWHSAQLVALGPIVVLNTPMDFVPVVILNTPMDFVPVAVLNTPMDFVPVWTQYARWPSAQLWTQYARGPSAQLWSQYALWPSAQLSTQYPR